MANTSEISVGTLEILLELLGRKLAAFRSVTTFLDLHKIIHKGLPYHSYELLRKQLDVTQSELAALLLIAPRTIQRRKQSKTFTADESDRLLRLARLFARAIQVLGDRETSLRWLKSPLPALGGKVPWEYIDTDVGIQQIEDILGRIEYGVYG